MTAASTLIGRAPAGVHDPLLGTLLDGRFRVQDLLARGGVGMVYTAEDTKAERRRDARVVIKVLSPDRVGDVQAEGRFDREAKRLNQLFHPNIVRLLATGAEPGGRAFMVMEYVDGVTLQAYLEKRKRLDIEDFAPIAAQILKAIGYAHTQGMIHRDLKPSNIMLCTRNGRANVVKILDFGLARLIEGDQQITTDQVVGTAGFLAPEQYDGRTIDQRVDVYALGILFYTMLAGAQPFAAETGAQLMYKHLHETPSPLGQMLPPTHGVPDGVIELVMQALSKEPDARQDTANEMTEQLFESVHASMFQLPVATKKRPNPPVPGRADRSGSHLPTTPVMTVTADDGLALVEESGPHASASSSSKQVAVRSGVYKAVRTNGSSSGVYAKVRVSPPKGTPRVTSTTNFDAMVAPQRQSQPTWVWVVLCVAVLCIGGGIYMYLNSGGQTAGQQTMVVADALDRVDRLIVSGEFEQAHDALALLTERVQGSDLLKNRHEQLRNALQLARLVEQARAFESEDKLEEARSAYRDILSRDNNHPVARERLLELNAMIVVPVEQGALQGSLLVTSTPTAELLIDGREVGPTPFLGNLEVGEHTFSIALDGYEAWETKVEVAADENPPLAVELVSLASPGPRPKRPRTPSHTPDVEVPEQPAEPVEPPQEQAKKKKSIFLPAGKKKPEPAPEAKTGDEPKKKKKSIFLPTGAK